MELMTSVIGGLWPTSPQKSRYYRDNSFKSIMFLSESLYNRLFRESGDGQQ